MKRCKFSSNYSYKLESNLTYHAVGHGLFSTGRILIKTTGNLTQDAFNYVYDCGTRSKGKFLSDKISNFSVKNNEDFDLAVISHFDKDHVNGFEKLLINRRVKKLVLPYLQPKQRLFFALKYYSYNKDISSMIYNPTSYFKEFSEEIIYIVEGNDKYEQKYDENSKKYNGRELNKENFKNDFILKTDISKIYSDLELMYYNLVKFKFFNKEIDDSQLTCFYRDVESILDKYGVKLDENLFYNKTVINEIKKIYKKLPYGINNSSICMSVTSIEESLNFKAKNCKCIKSQLLGVEPYHEKCQQIFGYMFTGDLSLNDTTNYRVYNDFIEYYNEEKKKISIFTIPHHGSKHNWNKDLLNQFSNAEMIITAAGNKLHPAPIVLRELSVASRANTTVNHTLNKEFFNEVYYVSKK